MADLLLHSDQFWIRTVWPVTVAAVCVWLASKTIPNPRAGTWLWRACVVRLLAIAFVPVSFGIPFLPAENPAPPDNPPRPIATIGKRDARGVFHRIDSQIEPANRPVEVREPVAVPQRRPDAVISVKSLCERGWYLGIGVGLLGLTIQWIIAARRLRSLPRLDSARVSAIADATACEMGLWKRPPIFVGRDTNSPRLTGLFRPTLVLPGWLVECADDDEIRLILAHEFAHAKCRDLPWNFLAAITTTLFFFHPLAWLARTRLRVAQELAADDVTLRVTGADAARYGELILKIVEKAGGRSSPAWLATNAGCSFTELKERIERMHSRPKSSALFLAVAVVALVAGLIPWHAEAIRTAAAANNPSSESSKKATPAGQPHWIVTEAPQTTARSPRTASTSEFPYEVQFEQGASKQLEGDGITILEVRGTAETFMPGNLYWIRGTYKLATQERAMLAAFTTAKDEAHGKGSYFKVQTAIVPKGDGAFTLFLPMSCEGWPHVSFYPVNGGSDLGGTYFGTGDSVLRRWWGSK